MKKLLSILLTSLLVVGVLGACSKQEASDKKKVLVMGTSADYKPYEYIDSAKSDEIIGFDVDVAKYIAKELGYEIKIKDMDFTGLLAAMEAKKVDFVMAGMTPTEERKKNADFTDVYFTAKNLVISKDGVVQKVEDLKGKTVGVQTGSIQEGKAKDIQKTTEIKITDRNRIPELFEELKAGRVDAIIIEDTVAKGYLKKMSELKSIEIPEASDEAGSAIAFPKGSKQTEEFNKVIEKMQKNGEMEKLVKKWFGGE
ncbi:transporter substrate-binding domain-containing protein [Ectobacillus sp. JY-23]|uniref:transporter substrate-binding domain-containing protein n=1 Tax=Ectobacillus sp. JY-23 TaxID=2933872 RepID=UPI001FF613B3|nr:transporter substrate-binding domain-containing protein [Ectobacillus sp. JY-23]UOY93918.1 transporter substrate-binding domain-containing protein [Ectobacillus sp. JY-23]